MEKSTSVLLHTKKPLKRTWINRVFALVYASTVLALLYHHLHTLLITTIITNKSTNNAHISVALLMLVADMVLAFMWFTHQIFRLFPIKRRAFPENLVKDESKYPSLDVFICTADPYREPPMDVANAALSVMAYDYPTEKLSVYVSDDGGSQLTLFALMEAAEFAKHWLPFCRLNGLVVRSPEAYFKSLQPSDSLQNIHDMKVLYESMKKRVENVVIRGSVDCSTDDSELDKIAFSKWTEEFTSQDHPSVIQVILESKINKDVNNNQMPNLIYVSREKRKATPHHFKGGALNTLIRVSAIMTNAPLVLTIDCDVYSNDPQTPLRVLCYMMDPCVDPNLAFVQFPQRFNGINKNDVYSAEFKNWTEIDAVGLDGILGPNYMGTGCFFRRRAFFGTPASVVQPECPQLRPDHVPCSSSLQEEDVLALALDVSRSNYEASTQWGSEMGFIYGSLVEDYYTSFLLHCKGWRSIYCNPDRPAFLGNAPINLHDFLIMLKRYSIGLLDMAFGKTSPITFGVQSMNLLQALGYTHYSFWPVWSIPITIYASDPWFIVYAFLFAGSYVQDFMEYILNGGTYAKWWNNQRMWMIRGISSFPFAVLEYTLGCFGLSAPGYSVTSKVVDVKQNQRYEQGMFEFGVASPLFFPVTTTAILNLVAFSSGVVQIWRNANAGEDMFVQMFIAGFVVLNSWPVYDAIIFRADTGKMPLKVSLISVAFACIIYLSVASAF
ncbi:hypothetical protein DCAR_0521747 [Daucus carota subsp. sativus]|uniref:Cellulose synthase-like protein G3 n=1 Tax=Daucus carota subsp. sativus TaxID=79200 RepID=A0AAF0X6P0_DAUCS|nr:hypothetical protein DCAR_0521747 [Daucus carota subsp. sativus]